ncbi:MAG: enoyl-CoA hydratase/isomerase family protein [Syntrophobacter sp.]
MEFVTLKKEFGIATIVLARGKVNALNETVVEEIGNHLARIETDDSLGSIILTGHGKFFTFGFDIPGFLNHTREEFAAYLHTFTGLCARIFTYPKPVIAALNGHTIAGGCMLATACDFRLMVTGGAKISLNEINFGSSVFAGSVEILKHCVGARNAERILYSGKMFTAEEAAGLGLVDRVTSAENLLPEAMDVAREFAAKSGAAFAEIKKLLRNPLAEAIAARERTFIEEFIRIWYSPQTWENLRAIKIAG